MPKISQKNKLIKFVEQIGFYELFLLELFGNYDEDQRKKENNIMEELLIALASVEYFRYSVPFVHYSIPKSRKFLRNVLPNLDENRFKQIVRVSWPSFSVILNLIKDDKVFHGPRSCQQFPVEVQLVIVLYRLGSSGEGATVTKIASLFGIGDGGTIEIITNRIFTAILNLKNEFLFWPDDLERRRLVSESLQLPHCVGFVDGTEVKLAEKPSEDPEAYFSRKHSYSIKVQAVCDNKLQIRHIVVGYPGSVHDARIYNNCDLSTKSSEYLKGLEWIAGDSAYKLTSTVITPFRSNSTEFTLKQRNDFNKIFSRNRIKIEHCFGQLKERFNSMKELKIQIKNVSSLKFACRWIIVCAILHNVIIHENREDIFEMQNDLSEDDENEESENFTQALRTSEGEVKRRALLELIQELNP